MKCSRAVPTFVILSLVSVAMALANLSSVAAATKAPDDLPKGSDVLERHVKATGGRASYDKIKNRVIKATTTFIGLGIKLSSTTYAAKPNKSYTLSSSDLTGKIEQGCDGRVAWTISVQMGPVVRKGAERAAFLRLSAFDGIVYWTKHFKTAECTGTETIKGKRCYKVVLTVKPTGDKEADKGLKPSVLYVDAKSHLVVKRVDTLPTKMGDIKIESFPEDYKKVDGILIPHKIPLKILGQDRLVTVKGIKHNVDLPKDRFQIPKAIRELVDKDEKKAEK